MSTCQHQDRRGMALVELLAAIVVVLLAAAIAAPALMDRLAATGDDHTIKNFQAIHTAFELYLMDWGYYPVAHNLHNDAYTWEPDAYHSRERDPMEPFWWEALASYVWDPLAFKDPMDKAMGMSYGQGYDSMYDYWKDRLKEGPYFRTNGMSCSYVYNGTLGWVDLWQKTGGGIIRPGTNCHYYPSPRIGGPSPKSYCMIVRPDARYLVWGWIGICWRLREGGYSAAWPVLFCDGHIKMMHWRDFDEVAQLPDAEALVCWWIPPECDRAP